MLWALAFLPGIVPAHHGVASLGATGLEGPGAPIETTVSTNLPQGSWLLYQKFDYASFKTYTPDRDDEKDYNLFSITGLGYGISPWFTAYAFRPYKVGVQPPDFHPVRPLLSAVPGLLPRKRKVMRHRPPAPTP